VTTATKRPPWQRRPSLFRENSSNGAKNPLKLSGEIYEPKKGLSSDFREINIFGINNLENRLTGQRRAPFSAFLSLLLS
jgi:hypothetical protein